MRRGWTIALAGLICLSVLLGAGLTHDERARRGRIGSASDYHPPTLTCPTGYDRDGRCVLRNLMGGIHGYLVPGALAALVAGLGGIGAGLALTIGGGALAGLTQVVLNTIESIPRLGILLLVYVLSQHSLLAFGGALGAVMLPGLAEEVAERIRTLQSADFVAASRAHGLSEARVVLYHLVWLGCGAWVLRSMFFTFGYTLIAETSLSFMLGGQTSSAQISWGESLYETRKVLGDQAYEVGRALSRGQSPDIAWAWGLPQFLSTALVILLVLWSTQVLGEAAWSWLQGEGQEEVG